MSKKTVAQLDEELQDFREEVGNVTAVSGIVWNLDQLKDVIEREDSHNEMIKLEVIHGFEPGKKCYHWTILKYQHKWL